MKENKRLVFRLCAREQKKSASLAEGARDKEIPELGIDPRRRTAKKVEQITRKHITNLKIIEALSREWKKNVVESWQFGYERKTQNPRP